MDSTVVVLFLRLSDTFLRTTTGLSGSSRSPSSSTGFPSSSK
jgi:hypothetical protein